MTEPSNSTNFFRIHSFLFFLTVIGLLSFQEAAVAQNDIRSKTFELSPNQDFDHELPIDVPSVFNIENSAGDIRVVATDKDRIRLLGHYRGESSAKLAFREVEAGKIKILVEYPSGSVVISGSVSVISGGGRVVINGQEVSARTGGVVRIGGSGEARLEVQIPRQMLSHLKAKTSQGNVFAGGFADDNIGDNRQLILATKQGDVEVRGVSAKGGVKVDTNQGNASASEVIGDLNMESKQGNITAINGRGDIHGETNMGNIQIAGQVGHVDAQTKMGNISLNNPNALSETATSKMGNVTGLQKRGCNGALPKLGDGTFNF